MSKYKEEDILGKQLRKKLLSAEFELIQPKEELMREYRLSKWHKKKMQKSREELRLEKVKKVSSCSEKLLLLY